MRGRPRLYLGFEELFRVLIFRSDAFCGDRQSAASAQEGRKRKVVREIKHVYEVRPRKDHRGVDLISDALPFGRLWNCARIVFDCRMSPQLRNMSSVIPARFTAHGAL